MGEQESESGFTTHGEEEVIAFTHDEDSLAVSPDVDMRAAVGWGRDLGHWGHFSVELGCEYHNWFDVFNGP